MAIGDCITMALHSNIGNEIALRPASGDEWKVTHYWSAQSYHYFTFRDNSDDGTNRLHAKLQTDNSSRTGTGGDIYDVDPDRQVAMWWQTSLTSPKAPAWRLTNTDYLTMCAGVSPYQIVVVGVKTKE